LPARRGHDRPQGYAGYRLVRQGIAVILGEFLVTALPPDRVPIGAE
jgi:hypothetical protein